MYNDGNCYSIFLQVYSESKFELLLNTGTGGQCNVNVGCASKIEQPIMKSKGPQSKCRPDSESVDKERPHLTRGHVSDCPTDTTNEMEEDDTEAGN